MRAHLRIASISLPLLACLASCAAEQPEPAGPGPGPRKDEATPKFETQGRIVKTLGEIKSLPDSKTPVTSTPAPPAARDPYAGFPQPDSERFRQIIEMARATPISPNAVRTLTVRRQVEIGEYSFFTLDRGLFLRPGPTRVTSGLDGMHFSSAGIEHTASVRIEAWSAPPALDRSERWEYTETSAFVSKDEEHAFTGAIAQMSEPFKWRAEGAYGVRVYSAGGKAIEKLALNYERARPGLERWLLQFWPLPDASGAAQAELELLPH